MRAYELWDTSTGKRLALAETPEAIRAIINEGIEADGEDAYEDVGLLYRGSGDRPTRKIAEGEALIQYARTGEEPTPPPHGAAGAVVDVFVPVTLRITDFDPAAIAGEVVIRTEPSEFRVTAVDAAAEVAGEAVVGKVSPVTRTIRIERYGPE